MKFIRSMSMFAGLAALGMLSGCATMLPIAGALVLKEAADRYEASNKPAEKPATVATVPNDAAPQVEQPEAKVTTRVASVKASKPQTKTPAQPAQPVTVASNQPEQSDESVDETTEEEVTESAPAPQPSARSAPTAPSKPASQPAKTTAGGWKHSCT